MTIKTATPQRREATLAMYRKICDGEIELEEAMKTHGLPYNPTPPSREERAEWIRAANDAGDAWRATHPLEKTEYEMETEWFAKIGKVTLIILGFLLAVLVTMMRMSD